MNASRAARGARQRYQGSGVSRFRQRATPYAVGRRDRGLATRRKGKGPGLLQLPARLRPREVAAERRVRDAVVTGQRPHRLAARAAAKQLRVGHEPAHRRWRFTPEFYPRLTHQQRTNTPAATDRGQNRGDQRPQGKPARTQARQFPAHDAASRDTRPPAVMELQKEVHLSRQRQQGENLQDASRVKRRKASGWQWFAAWWHPRQFASRLMDWLDGHDIRARRTPPRRRR
jgi:hypothetical protein